MGAAPVDVPAFPFQMLMEKTVMTSDDALDQFRHIARERTFGRHVGSDRLIQAGLDALMAGVESPSLALPAGLLRSEEPEAPELFDQVLEELGLLFRPPANPQAAKWAMAYWIAGQIADGSLDPAAVLTSSGQMSPMTSAIPKSCNPLCTARTTWTAGRRVGGLRRGTQRRSG